MNGLRVWWFIWYARWCAPFQRYARSTLENARHRWLPLLSLPPAQNMLLGMYFQFLCSFHVLPRPGGFIHTLTSLHEVAVKSDYCDKAAAPHTETMMPAFCYAALLSLFAPSSPGASKLPVKGFLCYLSSSPTLPRLLYESSLLYVVSSDAQTSKPDGFFVPTLIICDGACEFTNATEDERCDVIYFSHKRFPFCSDEFNIRIA